jgi:pilus assembly protein CpaB
MLRKVINLKTILTFIFALVIAYMTYTYLSSLKRTATVVITNQDIKAHTPITDSMLAVTEIDSNTKEKLFSDAFQSVDEVKKSVAKRDIPKGTVLTKRTRDIAFGEEAYQYLRGDGSANSASFIPYDKRAMSVSIDAEGAVGNTLKNGDFVDVIFTSLDNSTGGVYSSTILQHLEIMNVDKGGEGGVTGRAGKSNVTLLVTPEQAVDLALAKRRGVIDLVLNPLDVDSEWIPPTSPLKFVQKPKSAPQPAVPKPSSQPKPAPQPAASNTKPAPQPKPSPQPPAQQPKPSTPPAVSPKQ